MPSKRYPANEPVAVHETDQKQDLSEIKIPRPAIREPPRRTAASRGIRRDGIRLQSRGTRHHNQLTRRDSVKIPRRHTATGMWTEAAD
jgi:hypothetical protein